MNRNRLLGLLLIGAASSQILKARTTCVALGDMCMLSDGRFSTCDVDFTLSLAFCQRAGAPCASPPLQCGWNDWNNYEFELCTELAAPCWIRGNAGTCQQQGTGVVRCVMSDTACGNDELYCYRHGLPGLCGKTGECELPAMGSCKLVTLGLRDFEADPEAPMQASVTLSPGISVVVDPIVARAPNASSPSFTRVELLVSEECVGAFKDIPLTTIPYPKHSGIGFEVQVNVSKQLRSALAPFESVPPPCTFNSSWQLSTSDCSQCQSQISANAMTVATVAVAAGAQRSGLAAPLLAAVMAAAVAVPTRASTQGIAQGPVCTAVIKFTHFLSASTPAPDFTLVQILAPSNPTVGLAKDTNKLLQICSPSC